MNTEKRKPLDRAIEEFVFGTKEALPPPPFVVSPFAPAAFQTAETSPTASTPFALLSNAAPPKPFASAPEPVPIQSKEPGTIGKLQALDKEATVRFTADMSETLHRKLSMLAACDGAQESGPECGCCWRMG